MERSGCADAPAREHRLGVLDGLGFDAAAADGADVEPRGGDEHLAAGVLRRAADGVDQRDADERHAAGGELGEAFDVSVRGGHGTLESNSRCQYAGAAAQISSFRSLSSTWAPTMPRPLEPARDRFAAGVSPRCEGASAMPSAAQRRHR